MSKFFGCQVLLAVRLFSFRSQSKYWPTSLDAMRGSSSPRASAHCRNLSDHDQVGPSGVLVADTTTEELLSGKHGTSPPDDLWKLARKKRW